MSHKEEIGNFSFRLADDLQWAGRNDLQVEAGVSTLRRSIFIHLGALLTYKVEFRNGHVLGTGSLVDLHPAACACRTRSKNLGPVLALECIKVTR